MTLKRFAFGPWGTFGIMRVGDTRLYTIERPWLDNRKSVSCIPPGLYPMSRHNWFTKPGAQWRIDDVPNRSAILIHIGNTIDDIEGCIAPGMELGWVKQRWAVIRSRDATAEFNEAMARRGRAVGTIEIKTDLETWRVP